MKAVPGKSLLKTLVTRDSEASSLKQEDGTPVPQPAYEWVNVSFSQN